MLADKRYFKILYPYQIKTEHFDVPQHDVPWFVYIVIIQFYFVKIYMSHVLLNL